MTELVLKPGNATLADWREVYRGAVPRLNCSQNSSLAMR